MRKSRISKPGMERCLAEPVLVSFFHENRVYCDIFFKTLNFSESETSKAGGLILLRFFRTFIDKILERENSDLRGT